MRATFLTNIKHPNSALITKTTAVPIDVTPVATVSAVKTAVSTSSVKTIKKKTIVTTSQVSFSGLHQGMHSSAVTALQKKLAAYLGLSSSGNVTGYFGAKTEANLIAFQLKKGIIASRTSPGAGLIGPKTNKALGAV